MKKPISKTSFFQIRDDKDTSHRKCFTASGIQKDKQYPSFSVNFSETIKPLYEASTGFRLRYSSQWHNYWHFLNSAEEIATVEHWEKAQGSRIFLRDCLACSIALDMYTDQQHVRTPLGQAFHTAKYNTSLDIKEKFVASLKDHMLMAISEMPFYKDTKYICAVPPRPGKEWDLPSRLAAEIASHRGITDLTQYFSFSFGKPAAKNLSRDAKWDAWEACTLTFSHNMKENDIILIDDLYQSGISINYIGMILQKANAGRLFGICVVKSLNDSDNILN